MEDCTTIKPLEVIMDIVVHDPNTGDIKTQLIEWQLTEGEELLGTTLVTTTND